MHFWGFFRLLFSCCSQKFQGFGLTEGESLPTEGCEDLGCGVWGFGV